LSTRSDEAGRPQLTLHRAWHLALQRITVNSVFPDAADNGSGAFQMSEVRQPMSQLSAFKRLGEPEEIADLVVFLAPSTRRAGSPERLRMSPAAACGAPPPHRTEYVDEAQQRLDEFRQRRGELAPGSGGSTAQADEGTGAEAFDVTGLGRRAVTALPMASAMTEGGELRLALASERREEATAPAWAA